MKGFRLALPYGPNYRDPEQFTRAACNELSVDMASLREAFADERERASLTASLDDARATGMSISAHGVASRSDWELATNLAIDTVAGPCFGAALVGDCFADEVLRRPAWKGFR